jgi:peptidoglycan/LPS O-acetylase OafA/YrhL
MRIAAGIMLMILGALILVACVVVLIDYDTNVHDPLFDIAFMFCGAFLVTGGVFCLKKKGVELCLGSTVIAIFLTIGWFKGSYASLTWWDWACCVLGVLPIIFVCLRIREWQEVWA